MASSAASTAHGMLLFDSIADPAQPFTPSSAATSARSQPSSISEAEALLWHSSQGSESPPGLPTEAPRRKSSDLPDGESSTSSLHRRESTVKSSDVWWNASTTRRRSNSTQSRKGKEPESPRRWSTSAPSSSRPVYISNVFPPPAARASSSPRHAAIPVRKSSLDALSQPLPPPPPLPPPTFAEPFHPSLTPICPSPDFLASNASTPMALPSPAALPPIDHPILAVTPPSAGVALPSVPTIWPQATTYLRPDISASTPALVDEPLDIGELLPTRRSSEEGFSAQRDAKSEKLYHTLMEIVETEHIYLEALRNLVNVYFQTLPFLTSLTAVDVTIIQRNATFLLEMHERIGLELGDARLLVEIARGDEASLLHETLRVVRIFEKELPNFDCYNLFCARHGEALDLVRSIESSSDWEVYERQCALVMATARETGDITPIASHSAFDFSLPDASTSSSNVSTITSHTRKPRLRFQDYAIQPMQRICRYPLVFGQVMKTLGDCEERVAVKRVWEGLRRAAEGVDEAKRAREGELRTRIIANRLELACPITSSFETILGPTLLIGSLHVVHRSISNDSLRLKYWGAILHKTHLEIGRAHV